MDIYIFRGFLSYFYFSYMVDLRANYSLLFTRNSMDNCIFYNNNEKNKIIQKIEKIIKINQIVFFILNKILKSSKP